MSKKTILVLAASPYQVPVIERAKQMGMRVITADNIPDNPGHQLADRSYNVDTTDRDGILSIGREEKVDGVIAACTDVAVPTSAYVSSRLGLWGLPVDSSEICCDKIAFRKFLQKHGYPVPRVYPFTAAAHPPANIFTNKWIIKPDRASGSKGVFIVSSHEEFLLRLVESLPFSPTGKGICESFIEGFQGTCEGVIHHSKVIWHMITDRRTAKPPYVTTFGHRVPCGLPPGRQRRLISMIEDLFRQLRITDGVFDCDFVSSDQDMFVLEISPRLGGNSLTALVRHAAGFDIIGYAIGLACHVPQPQPSMPEVVLPSELLLFGVSRAGTLQYNQEELTWLRQESWVKELSLDYPPGVKVLPFINGRHRLGQAIVCADHSSELDDHVNTLHSRLSLEVS